jgi:lysophospholipase L1-like esterase
VLLGLAAGVVLLGAVELGMRALDVGARTTLFTPEIGEDGEPRIRLSWNPQFDIPEPPRPLRSFLRDKPAGTFRIFVIGESSAAGIPYGLEYSFAAWLARRLEAEAPGVRWEVVSAAFGGATSRSMVTMAREIARHQPDLLVVYLGHNEIGAHLTPEERAHLDPDRRPWWTPLTRLRLYRTVAEALPRPSKRLGVRRPEDAGDRLGTPRDYASDADRRLLVQAYRARIEEIVGLMRDAGAQTALLTLSQNFSDWPPNVSVHRRRLSPEQKQRWRAAVRRGRELAEHDDCPAAIAAWREALALDDGYAMLHYEIAGCARRTGQLDLARTHFRLASDLDMFSQGALSPQNDALRDVAEREGAILVDVEAELARASGERLVGDDLFVDAMHPNLRGNQLIAQAVAEALRRENRPLPAERWREGAYTDPPPETILDSVPGLRAMEHLTYAVNCMAAHDPECARPALEAARAVTTDPAQLAQIEQALKRLGPARPSGAAR